MDTTETGGLCRDVGDATDQIRALTGYRTDIGEALNIFWVLQDSLNRLVESVERERGEVGQCRTVIRRVVNALESPQARKLSTVPGVKNSCEKINGLLMTLERTTQRAKTAGTGS